VADASWVLLSSRLPRVPTRLRLAVWRRLRRAGAILLHDAVWVLPADPATREAVEWLAQEIEEQGGTAFAWEAASLGREQDRDLMRRFREEADGRYQEIARSARAIRKAAFGRRSRRGTTLPSQALRQLRGLERALREERRRDWFRAAARGGAEEAVRVAAAELEGRRPLERGGARAVGD
jgi:hypothetical protein